MRLLSTDFESVASASSTTPAFLRLAYLSISCKVVYFITKWVQVSKHDVKHTQKTQHGIKRFFLWYCLIYFCLFIPFVYHAQ